MPEIKFKAGDDPSWSNPDYDDSDWALLSSDQLRNIQGVYWVRSRLIIGDEARQVGHHFDFKMRMLASYELFLNGELIGMNGQVGRVAQEEVPGRYENIFRIPRHIVEEDSVVLSLRLSSWHRQYGDRLYFDPLQRLANNRIFQHWNFQEAVIGHGKLDPHDLLELMFVAVPIIVGLYFFFLFIGHRKSRHYLVFSVLCFSFFVLGLADIFWWAIGYSYDKYILHWWTLTFCIGLITLLFPTYFLVKYNLKRKWVWLGGLFIAATLVAAQPIVVFGMDDEGQLIIILVLMTSLAIHVVAFLGGGKGLLPSFLGVLSCLIGIMMHMGAFFLCFGILLTLILAQLAMEHFQQQRSYLMSLVNASRLETELLRKHIQPHFLMNSLTSLMEWVEVDPEKGAEFVEALGSEFRLLTLVADRPLISLGQELELCRLHLQIMGFRLQKQFRLELNGVDTQERIPPAVFHTLAENGISHNSYTDPIVTFHLSAERKGDRIRYQFKTPFVGLKKVKPGGDESGSGMGLKYIKAQLERAFPAAWQMKAAAEGNHWLTLIDIRSSGEEIS